MSNPTSEERFFGSTSQEAHTHSRDAFEALLEEAVTASDTPPQLSATQAVELYPKSNRPTILERIDDFAIRHETVTVIGGLGSAVTGLVSTGKLIESEAPQAVQIGGISTSLVIAASGLFAAYRAYKNS